jgi:hypothetical protein
VSLYGFIQPSWIGASTGVDSFSQPNMSAYTAASNPVLDPNFNRAQSSFQVAQSRFGLLVKPEEKFSGRIEMDFVNFSKASPTTQALPRLRRASIDYKTSENVTFRFGQDWDLMQAQMPFTYNWVGHYFETGDIGFMRIQAMALVQSGDFEHGFAVGLPTSNGDPANNAIEVGMVPTVSFREVYKSHEGTQLGFAVIGSSLLPASKTGDRFFAGAGTLFGGTKVTPALEILAKAYIGQNTSNLGMLGLGYTNGISPSIREAGGYLTGRATLSESIALFGGLGGSWVLNTSDLSPSYNVSAAGAYSLSGNGTGILYNLTARLGGEWKAEKNLAFFLELASLHTKYQLLAADLSRTDPMRQSLVTQTGVQLNF